VNTGPWKILAGLAVIAVLVVVWVQYDRTNLDPSKDGAAYNDAKSFSKTKAANFTTKGIAPTKLSIDPALDIVASEQILTANITAMEAEQGALVPMEAEARSLAKATANMSITQMAELQKLRQGEVVRSMDGQLQQPYLEREQCTDGSVCKTVVVNSRSGETAWDGAWAKEFVETGVDLEVVKARGR